MTLVERIWRAQFVNPATALGAAFYALLFLGGAIVLAHGVRLTFARLNRRDDPGFVDDTAVAFLTQLLQTAVYVAAGILYAHLIPELRTLGTAMLAGASVASIVLGLAAQSTLGNLIAGLALLLYRPFRVGDRLQMITPGGMVTAVVETLTLGYTFLRTPDGRRGRLGAYSSRGSMKSTIVLMTSCLLAVAATTATGQTRAGEIEQAKAAKAAQVRPPEREKGDRIVAALERYLLPAAPYVRPVVGGFRPGAGLNVGAEGALPAGKHALLAAGGGWSVHDFKRAHLTLTLPRAVAGRVDVRASASFLDEPALGYFGVGIQTNAGDEVEYGLQSKDVSIGAAARAGRWFKYGGSAGYLDVRSTLVRTTAPSSDDPGIGASPAWARVGAFAGVDTRRSPGYTDRGGLYRVAVDSYHDPDNAYSFVKTEVDFRQFIPILASNWIVALQARGQAAAPRSGSTVPFFLLPTIGGRDSLPGFADYRFSDRVGLLLRAELRWTAAPVVDTALFIDHGTVAPSVRSLSLADMQRGVGIGVRLHSSKATVLRLEAARSREGWRFNLAQGVSF